ncbi:MAG: DOMON-like domain-containing protein [Betaproteobacteria bacterium]
MSLAAQLTCHPESGNEAVRAIGVSLRRSAENLYLAYTIEGDLARLSIPLPGTPRISHALWKHTCCECFIALAGRPEYHEWNLSPSREWTAYAFTGYRDGAALSDEALDPRIAVQRAADRLLLEATIPLARAAAEYARAPLELALCAVIGTQDGKLSYWALAHPAAKPDFHRRESFLLELPPA